VEEKKKQQGKDELEVLKKMIARWYKSYKKHYDGTDWSFLAEDFQEEVTQQVYPYVARLYTTGYIDNSMLSEFSSWCNEMIEKLKWELKPNHWVGVKGVISW